MRTIIAGSRNITDLSVVREAVERSGFSVTEVVSGGARGVDRLGERLAGVLGVPCRVFPADWDAHGRSAGVIRNGEMADYADALVAVWDGRSRGTANMISQARRRGLEVYVHRPDSRVSGQSGGGGRMDGEFLEMLRKRRSIRRYRDRPVEAEKRDLLVEAALRSPSSRGINPWRFVFVEDRKKIAEVSRCKGHGSAFLEGAPLAVAVFARENESDVWVEDCSIASIVLQLAAGSLGLGSCWVQVRNRTREDGSSSSEYLRELLGLPEGYRAESVIGIGYPAETPPPHPDASLERHKAHMESWSGE